MKIKKTMQDWYRFYLSEGLGFLMQKQKNINEKIMLINEILVILWPFPSNVPVKAVSMFMVSGAIIGLVNLEYKLISAVRIKHL